MNEIQHLIDGHTVTGSSGDTGPVFDPATGEQTAKVALASAAEVDAAVASAKAAFDEWGGVSLARRTKLLLAFRNLVEGKRFVYNGFNFTARYQRPHIFY